MSDQVRRRDAGLPRPPPGRCFFLRRVPWRRPGATAPPFPSAAPISTAARAIPTPRGDGHGAASGTRPLSLRGLDEGDFSKGNYELQQKDGEDLSLGARAEGHARTNRDFGSLCVVQNHCTRRPAPTHAGPRLRRVGALLAHPSRHGRAVHLTAGGDRSMSRKRRVPCCPWTRQGGRDTGLRPPSVAAAAPELGCDATSQAGGCGGGRVWKWEREEHRRDPGQGWG